MDPRQPSNSIYMRCSQVAPLIKHNSVPTSTTALNEHGPAFIRTGSGGAGPDAWTCRAENSTKCSRWLMNEKVDGTSTPCEPTSPDCEGPTGTSRYSNEFGNAYASGWNSSGRRTSEERGSWWESQATSGGSGGGGVSESEFFRSAYASTTTESRASTCGQTLPPADPNTLPRRCSLDVALDKMTASVQGSLQLSRQQQQAGGGGGRRNERRSLDMMLDEVESPSEIGGTWACSTKANDWQRFFG